MAGSRIAPRLDKHTRRAGQCGLCTQSPLAPIGPGPRLHRSGLALVLHPPLAVGTDLRASPATSPPTFEETIRNSDSNAARSLNHACPHSGPLPSDGRGRIVLRLTEIRAAGFAGRSFRGRKAVLKTRAVQTLRDLAGALELAEASGAFTAALSSFELVCDDLRRPEIRATDRSHPASGLILRLFRAISNMPRSS